MKKIITFLTIFPLYLFSFSITKEDVDTAVNNLCNAIVFQQPHSFGQEIYTELAYLKRNYNLTQLKIKDSIYLKKIFNNYYYDKYYLYSKFLNENAIITEDCLHGKSTESLHKGNKLLFYVLYPNSIKLPVDIIEQIDEYATIDELFGPYKMLTVIYYLKKYNYQNLSTIQKDKLNVIENHLSKLLFNKYIDNKPWSFTRLLSVKVLKMNKNELVKDLDISTIVNLYKSNIPLFIFEVDKNDKKSFNGVSYNDVLQLQANALLWIFLLEEK